MQVPLIFCHFGNSYYLRYTFECAKLHNPNKEIILLGDEENNQVCETLGIRHYLFDNFASGVEIEKFNRVYRLIQGTQHVHKRGGRDWVNFVFKRWFYVYNFVLAKNIRQFWHFDSDNMIMCDLNEQEKKFRDYDCTEQCNGICMNGFIANTHVAKGYIEKINEIFQREEFLASQQKEFDEIHPHYAFTEMRAYEIYKSEEKINSIKLNTIIDNESFDSCICESHDMETEHLKSGREIKKVYLNKDGRIFCYHIPSQRMIKMNSLNLSYVPDYICEQVLHHAKKKLSVTRDMAPERASMNTLVHLRVPLKYKIKKLYLVQRLSSIKAKLTLAWS